MVGCNRIIHQPPFRHLGLSKSAPPEKQPQLMNPTEALIGQEPFCLLDIETTGFSAESHEITEIAAIRVGADLEILEETSCLIRIENPVPYQITRITGITDQLLRTKGRSLNESIRDIHHFTHAHTTFAHNAKFDQSFLNASAQRIGLRTSFQLKCSIPVFKRLLPGHRSYGLPKLVAALGLNDSGAHRALADCRMLLECLRRAHGG
jgi:DNA polymerase III alpha subunit (gram-positive type)